MARSVNEYSSKASSSVETEGEFVALETYEELQRDFMEFTYIVSHDFQAPLRHIHEFSRLLVDKLSDKVGPKELEYVRIINASIERCEAMMAALLEYSRLNTRGEAFVPSDCNMIVEQAVASLRRHMTINNADIKIDPLPTVRGDPGQLKQLFYQLISNAIKFARPDAAPQVHIYAAAHDNGYEFFIEDNGIGIGPEYAMQIYTLFRKLDPSSPGVGIGLTLCKKIVARHKGRISFGRNYQNGTMFNVFLPK